MHFRKKKAFKYEKNFLRKKFEEFAKDSQRLSASINLSGLNETEQKELKGLIDDYLTGLEFLCAKILDHNYGINTLDEDTIEQCMPYTAVSLLRPKAGDGGYPLSGYHPQTILEALRKIFERRENLNHLCRNTPPETFVPLCASSAGVPSTRKSAQIKTIESEWSFVFSDKFFKSINKIDRKLQGRIWDALVILKDQPTTHLGNTIKPLVSKQLKGLWRYRIGDYRIIYAPMQTNKKILFLKFSPRSQAYEA